MIKQSVMMIALCAAIFVTVKAQAQTRQLYDPNEPGSVLVFPKFVNGTVATDLPATEIVVSAHCPDLAANGGFCPSGDGAIVRIRGNWVCPGCSKSTINIQTTVEGTAFTLTPPATLCPEGYLILWAIDASGRPIKFDSLVGDAVVRWNSHAAGSYKGIAIQADAALATNAAITGTTPTFRLPFDGLAGHYAAVTGKVMSTIKYDTDAGSAPAPDAPSTTSLTLLTLDVLSSLNSPVSTVLNFSDQNQILSSITTSYTCWEEIPISSLNPGLVRQNMGRKGFFYSANAVKAGRQVTQLGLIDTVECQGTVGGICGPPAAPVTSTNNQAIVNHYMYRAFDDSVPVPTSYVP